ncbi:MAG: CHAT domain-containing protein, partial [Micromonosporaceae bacterium]|nr:CHAT domain-containing protein [Micromonosporaceae bacterium]
MAGSDPARAAALGSALAARAVAAGDLAAASIAQRALGLAALHTKDVDVAIAHLREAVTHARRCGSPRLAAQARMTLAFAHSSRGRSRQGLREIETALGDLDGVDQARAQAQRAAILLQLGRRDEALEGYNATLPVLRGAQDWTWVWRVLSNRAVLHGQRLELAAAEADLREAAQLCERLELRTFAAYTQQNLGWVATLAGDVPAALSYLDDAERRLRALDSQIGVVLRDRAELLLSVYLVAEARAAAQEAIAALEHEHRYNVLPEARLLLARAATLDGDPALAVAQARRAALEFRRQGRTDWYAAARLAVLISGDDPTPRRAGRAGSGRAVLREAERVAETLEAARWSASAIEA